MLQYNTLIVLIGTTLLGMVSGALGTYLVLRRRSLIGDAVAHAALPGLCIAFMVVQERSFLAFMVGAFISALIGSWMVNAIQAHTRVKEDAAIGIVLSVLFGLGIVLSRYIQGHYPGANKAGLDSFIFGKTAGMIRSDVYGIIAVCIAVLCLMLLLHKEFKLLSFDREFAIVLGWPVSALDLLMMGLACVTSIIGLPAVGLALMAAMLIIPGAAARFWTDRLDLMIALSGLFGMITGAAGTLASAYFAQLPTGPIIILNATAIFLFSLFFSPKRGVIAVLIRRLQLNRRIEAQNLLRTLFELSEKTWPKAPWIRAEDLIKLRAWPLARARRLLHLAQHQGWLCREGDRYRLTEAGWQEAADVARVHRLWEIYLIEEAQAAPALVDRDAEEVEHILPPELVARLEARLDELGLLPKPLRVPRRHPALAAGEEGALP